MEMMTQNEHSPELGELAGALAKAQAEMGKARKSEANAFFKSKYADLASVIEAARPISAHGLAVTQFPNNGELITMLVHESGQWLKSRYPIKPVKDDPQGIGSAITYCRRYAYQSILGLATGEDDDGEAAMGRGQVREERGGKVEQTPPATESSSDWRDFVIPIGKEKGKTLGEVEPGLLMWFVKNIDDRNKQFRVALDLADREMNSKKDLIDFPKSKATIEGAVEEEIDDVPF